MLIVTPLYLYVAIVREVVKLLISQSCPALCNRIDCNPPGSSLHGTFQARIVRWVAIPPLQGIFPIFDPGIKPMFPAFQADS